MNFRILSLNLNLYGSRYGGWEGRKELIAETVEDLNPDILILQAVRQELNRENGLNQALQLAMALEDPYPYHLFQPAAIFDNGSADGLAFLARTPILETSYKPLTFQPGKDDPNRRVILRARFEIQGHPVEIFNAHFSWVEEQAKTNVREALDFVSSYSGYKILAGDLNNQPDSTVYQELTKHGLVDAWKQLNPDDPGFTYEQKSPDMRIDYIWLDWDLARKLREIKVVSGPAGPDNHRISDHAGLTALFEI